jgi:membrane fusion protein (multidrug efflux system)
MKLIDFDTDELTRETDLSPNHFASRSGPRDWTSSLAMDVPPARRLPRRRIAIVLAALVSLLAGGYLFAPTVEKILQTVSTDDAYVNCHVTFVASRITGQVARVLVDDNMRVSKGDVLVELDRTPYRLQVDIKKAAVVNAEAELKSAEAQVRAALGMVRNLSWKLQAATEEVDGTVALLGARVATLRSKEATLGRAGSDFGRAKSLRERAAISREEFDQRLESLRVAEAGLHQAQEEVLQTRVFLGLPPRPETGHLSDVPADLNQTSSHVRQVLAELLQCTSQLGLPWIPTTATPRQVLAEFISRSKQGNIDRTMERIVAEAPAVSQARTKRAQAERDLAQAELNLSYCEVCAEIDGVVLRRNVNPGNNVAACQSMMSIRSLTDVWIDANFKETQLADLKIGQRAEIEVDVYRGRKVFRGRVTGFTMGTGQTLAVLPAQNASGNFVKVVQRLPVRIELEGYDPEQGTLFAGLSATPYVYIKETPQGPWAGRQLQGLRPTDSTASK